MCVCVSVFYIQLILKTLTTLYKFLVFHLIPFLLAFFPKLMFFVFAFFRFIGQYLINKCV